MTVVDPRNVQPMDEYGADSTWKREFKYPWREAGPPDHLDDTEDSDQWVVNKDVSLQGCPKGL